MIPDLMPNSKRGAKTLLSGFGVGIFFWDSFAFAGKALLGFVVMEQFF